MSFEKDLEKLQKEILSPNIKILGEILGEVLQDQAGMDLFKKEEEIRLLAKEYRENDDYGAFNQLKDLLFNLPQEETSTIIKAFSHFFQLVNLAEEFYKVRINKIKDQEKTTTSTIEYTLDNIKKYNIDNKKLNNILSQLNIQLVWTSHPTEARRLTVMVKLRKIFDLLSKIQLFYANEYEYFRIKQEIKEELTALWQSDELREERVTLLDEVRTVLFYFDETVFQIIPELYRKLHHLVEQSGYKIGNIIDLPKMVGFGSWTGGDRDGHPGVTANITIQTLLLHKRLCLRKYRVAIERLIQHLSTSIHTNPPSQALLEDINRDAKAFPEFATTTRRLNIREPYRRKLDFIRLKLENSLLKVEEAAVEVGLGQTLVGATGVSVSSEVSTYYSRSTEFYKDLMIIYQSLLENKGEILAEGQLADLLIQVEVFGFHLAPLDLRQDADVHIHALNEVFSKIGLPDLSSLSMDDQSDILLRELINSRPLGVSSIFHQLSESTQEVFNTLVVASDSIQKISPRSINTYVISMSTHQRDVLALMLMMKETGLIRIQNGIITKAYIDIAPLFETKEDLANATSIMKKLYNMKLYQSYIDNRNNTQEIMIGYSDSTKDVGILESNYRLVVAQQELESVTREHG